MGVGVGVGREGARGQKATRMKANGRGEGDCGAVGVRLGGRHARGREGRNLGKERGDTLETPGTPLCKEVSVSFQ